MKTTRNAAANGSQITRPRFAMVPIRLLESCSDRKGTLFVYGWLWDYAGQADQAFPSVDRLAGQCRMKPDDVRSALRWLTDEGWIERIERPGLTTLFHVRQEALRSPAGQEASPPKGGSPKKGRGPLPQTGDPTPPPNGGPNNKHLTKSTYQEVLEPPLPPTGQRRDKRDDTHPYRDRDGFVVNPDQQPQATEAQPQPTQPVKPWESPQQPKPETPPEPQPALATVPVDPQPKSRKVSFTPTEGDVPAALLPVVSELLEFWPARSGAKTQRAWNLMLSEATRIQGHTHGGTEILRAQLLQGVKAKIQKGRGWASLDFDRWLQFGTKAGTPISGTGFRHRMTQDDHAAEALAFIRARDAKRAAEAAQQAQQTPILVEVA